MVDWRKVVYTIRIQLFLVIAIKIIAAALNYLFLSTMPEIETAQDIVSLLSNPLLVFLSYFGESSSLVMAWAGYAVSKKLRDSAVLSGLAGILVSITSILLGTILNYIFIFPVLSKMLGNIYSIVSGLDSQAFLSSLGASAPLGIVLSIVKGVIIGFILGAAGGLLESRIIRKSKKEKVSMTNKSRRLKKSKSQ